MGISVGTYSVTKLNLTEIESLNRAISIGKTEKVVKNPPQTDWSVQNLQVLEDPNAT